MVKMMLNLLTLEDGLQNLHHCLDHLAGKHPGFENDPTILNLRDRLQILEQTLIEALIRWPQLGLDLTD
ncbi:MAG: hypothetical protein ACOZF2_13545 [Thermodesulfobacteriota bacterium]